MKLYTTRARIRGVAEAWRRQYGAHPIRQNHAEILQRLGALNAETATPEDVRTIIGNGSWTSIACDECGKEVGAAVEVGQEPDYDSATAVICAGCLRAALALVDGDGPRASADAKGDGT